VDRNRAAARIARASLPLSRAALERMQADLPWFAEMPADQRAAIGLIVQGGVRAFADWLQHPAEGLRITGEVFAAAPSEFARQISLEQTVDLVRIAVGVAEERSETLAGKAAETEIREALLRYSRDLAFTVAAVYARAAEQRGAWDARLESLVVDAVVTGTMDDSVLSRAAALGWSAPRDVVVIVGFTPEGGPEQVVQALHQRGAAVGADVLGGVQDRRLVALVGTGRRLTRVVRSLLPSFASGPVVVGPVVTDLAGTVASARAALSALRVAHAWPDAPRPVAAEDLLPERALAGDADAVAALLAGVCAPLAEDDIFLGTVDAYLGVGASIEAAARRLWVHPNTVRYRLSRVTERIGRDIADPRERYVVQTALILGRLSGDL
jgi:DNA-binding PucR family transcriptional regulator